MTANQPLGQIGRYELTELLAVGGMGEIYLARMKGAANFEKRCVIKKILPHLATEEEFVRKFIDEANTVVQLTHGNIVPVFDMGESDGEFYIAMEFIPGLDLRTILKELKSRDLLLSVSATVHIICEVCKGLDYAHGKTNDAGEALDIIHRDISPSNILISKDGEVKLVDFGIAKASVRTTRSITGRLQGKFGYMSPEQARGEAVDCRTDIFSTGVVLYEALTGHRSFEGQSDLESLERVKSYAPKPPSAHRPELPPELDAIVLRAIAKNKADRYQTADELLNALLGYLVADGRHVTPSAVTKELESVFADGDKLRRAGARFGDLLDQQMDRLLADGATPTSTSPAKRIALRDSSGPSSAQNSLEFTATATASPEAGASAARVTPAPPTLQNAIEPVGNGQTPPEGSLPRTTGQLEPQRKSRLLAVAIILLAVALLVVAVVTLMLDSGPSTPAIVVTTANPTEKVNRPEVAPDAQTAAVPPDVTSAPDLSKEPDGAEEIVAPSAPLLVYELRTNSPSARLQVPDEGVEAQYLDNGIFRLVAKGNRVLQLELTDEDKGFFPCPFALDLTPGEDGLVAAQPKVTKEAQCQLDFLATGNGEYVVTVTFEPRKALKPDKDRPKKPKAISYTLKTSLGAVPFSTPEGEQGVTPVTFSRDVGSPRLTVTLKPDNYLRKKLTLDFSDASKSENVENVDFSSYVTTTLVTRGTEGPETADMYVDGQLLIPIGASTFASIYLQPGKHSAVAKQGGRVVGSTEFEVVAGRKNSVQIPLTPPR